MSVQAGRRELPRREYYAGARSGRSGAGRSRLAGDRRTKASSIKLLVCMSAFVLLTAVKFLYPAGAESIAHMLSRGIDYKAAITAMGKAITSGENITEVFKGITLGGFLKENGEAVTPSPSANIENRAPVQSPVLDDAMAVEAMAVTDISGKYTNKPGLRNEIDPSDAADQTDGEKDSGTADVSGTAGTTMEELLMRLPTEELEEGSEEKNGDPPENVSYDYYVIEFDYQTPLKGTITSGFGYRIHPVTGKKSFHYGVDIGGSTGDRIAAFSSGTVELTGYNSVYGNYVFLRHKDGIRTFYGHCSKILVEQGQLVRKGEYIAKVGSTGLSTGPHLHFEIRNGDVILNPLHYVSPDSKST